MRENHSTTTLREAQLREKLKDNGMCSSENISFLDLPSISEVYLLSILFLHDSAQSYPSIYNKVKGKDGLEISSASFQRALESLQKLDILSKEKEKYTLRDEHRDLSLVALALLGVSKKHSVSLKKFSSTNLSTRMIVGNTLLHSENWVPLQKLIEVADLDVSSMQNVLESLETLDVVETTRGVEVNRAGRDDSVFACVTPDGQGFLQDVLEAFALANKSITRKDLQTITENLGYVWNSDNYISGQEVIDALVKRVTHDEELLVDIKQRSFGEKVVRRNKEETIADLVIGAYTDTPILQRESIMERIGGLETPTKYVSDRTIFSSRPKGQGKEYYLRDEIRATLHEITQKIEAQRGNTNSSTIDQLTGLLSKEDVDPRIARKIVEKLMEEVSPEGIWRKAVRKILHKEPGQFAIVYRKKWPKESQEPGQASIYLADDMKGLVAQLASGSQENEPFLPELLRQASENGLGIKMAYTNLRGPDNREIPGQPNFLLMEIIDTSKVVTRDGGLGLDILSTNNADNAKYTRWKALASLMGNEAVRDIVQQERERLSGQKDHSLRR